MHRIARVFGVFLGTVVATAGVVGCQQPQHDRANNTDRDQRGAADQPDTRDDNGLSITAPLGIQITVNDRGVGVKAPGVDVRSDQDGVNVKAPGVDIRSDDKGVDVQAPGVSVRANEGGVDVQAPLGVRVRTGDTSAPATPAPATPAP